MDGRQLQFENERFDEVHLHYVVTQPDVHETDVVRMIRETHRVLKPNGSIVVTGEISWLTERQRVYTPQAIRAQGFSSLTESFDHLQSASVFYNSIMSLLKCRNEEESFLLIGRK